MAQPIRRGSRFPVSLFEPTALWDPVSELEYLRDRMGRLYNQITPQEPGQGGARFQAIRLEVRGHPPPVPFSRPT